MKIFDLSNETVEWQRIRIMKAKQAPGCCDSSVQYIQPEAFTKAIDDAAGALVSLIQRTVEQEPPEYRERFADVVTDVVASKLARIIANVQTEYALNMANGSG